VADIFALWADAFLGFADRGEWSEVSWDILGIVPGLGLARP
jgi:hypothetical protein